MTMNIPSEQRRTSRPSETALLAGIFRATADCIAAVRAQEEARTEALAGAVDAIRAALTARVQEGSADVSPDNPVLDDDGDMLRLVAAIMNAPDIRPGNRVT